MKKIFILLCFLILMTGCVKKSAPDVVRDYLGKYQNHDEEVVNSLKQLIQDENLYVGEQKLYELIMKKQYVNLKYKIKKETYNGDEADIETEIEVYDYIHSRKKALEYREKHQEEFLMEDNSFNIDKYKNLQLRYMNEETNRIKYTVTFHVTLEDDQWTLLNPDYTILQKIQGIYAYQED